MAKHLPKEFGESLSIGFVFTFYGFIFYSFGCFKDSYQLVKSNNLARYFIIWLGCWSAMGLRMVTLGVLPLVVVMGLSKKALPYNLEDIVFISNCLLLFGLHLSFASIEKAFGLEEHEQVSQWQSEGEDSNA